MTTPKPKPIPKPGPPAAGPSPAVVAAHATHPVKVPVASDVSEEERAAAAAFGSVADAPKAAEAPEAPEAPEADAAEETVADESAEDSAAEATEDTPAEATEATTDGAAEQATEDTVAADAKKPAKRAKAAKPVLSGPVVSVKDGDTSWVVGPAKGEDPLAPYIKAYFELKASIERFHARLGTAELSPKDIEDSLKGLRGSLAEPKVVGDLPALRERLDVVATEAEAIRDRILEERRVAREAALADRERIVARAEEISGKPENQVHWKNDTAELRSLLDEWKAAQRANARIAKDAEKALWKRFTTARSSFEKARKHHFAELDRANSGVASRKEELAAKAERLAESTDWDKTAREFRDLMAEWKTSGRGRRSVDDALWKRFQTAQDAFFEARRGASEAEDAALAENVVAKEAAVAEAEGILPIKDLNAAKQALRVAQDRFEEAGMVPRGDVARLNKRMGAVEKAVRDAEDARWTQRNPEIERRASGAAAQLQAAIAGLEADLAKAESKGDKRRIKEAEEALAARRSWLEQIEGVVK